jgi:hypothetical protein
MGAILSITNLLPRFHHPSFLQLHSAFASPQSLPPGQSPALAFSVFLLPTSSSHIIPWTAKVPFLPRFFLFCAEVTHRSLHIADRLQQINGLFPLHPSSLVSWGNLCEFRTRAMSVADISSQIETASNENFLDCFGILNPNCMICHHDRQKLLDDSDDCEEWNFDALVMAKCLRTPVRMNTLTGGEFKQTRYHE